MAEEEASVFEYLFSFEIPRILLRWLSKDRCVQIFLEHFPIEHVDVLVGGDNLSPHCSEVNLRESRELRELVKIAWAFTPGGCTDVVAGPDNNMVNLEKTFVRRYYRAARRDKENGPRWSKPPKDGGVKPYERRAHYMSWVSRARKEFLHNFQGEIWKRHQECGFVLAIDGSENDKLQFRDGKCKYVY